MFSILGKQKNQKDVNLQNQNQTEIASICTYLCTVFTELLQYKEVKLWFEIDSNGGSKMVLRLQVPKIVPKNETLVTKRHIEIPKGSGQKTFCAWTFKSEKIKSKPVTEKLILELTNFYLLSKTTALIFQKVCLPQDWEKGLYVGCSRLGLANVVYLLALYKQ